MAEFRTKQPSQLSALLRASGVTLSEAEVRAFVAGVAAAAEPRDGGWIDLIAPAATVALRARLEALRSERAAGYRSQGGGPERLAALRAELARRGLAGFLQPVGDEHQGEAVPPGAQRLPWLTGFTGSAGLVMVLAAQAALFTDGRYTLQAEAQVDGTLFARLHSGKSPPETWLTANLRAGNRFGYDPWLHAIDAVARLRAAVEKAGATLIACDGNPIDSVWPDRPPLPIAPVVPHDLRFAGQASADKRAQTAETLAAQGADAAVLTLPDSICWLLNIRGGDVANSPQALAFALLHRDGTVDLCIEGRKVTPGLAQHLGNAVRLAAPHDFGPLLDRQVRAGKRLGADPGTAPAWVFERIERAGAKALRLADPCVLPKARKNPVELAGTQAAHRRDGAALTRFLAAVAREAPRGTWTEIEAQDRLASCREGGEHYRGPSFNTISGAGPNGAIVHYRARTETNRRLEPGMLYLVDSGGQYLDGTTDVTRAVAIGAPSPEMRDRFTRVLKGHIALATARFPRGTTGAQLDALARRALWDAGLDYDHGTGHGVGSFMNVHEGPQRIAKGGTSAALEPGMIISVEPGYYKTGAYGIRIENLVVVVEVPLPEGAEVDLLGFETLTLAPIDRNLVEARLLTAEEIAWLDAYHARVCAVLTPIVDAETATWLVQATRPIQGG
ncbi:MAG: aminopeptidase P family protein [Alphaproteobacteria bacterium]|nr:aminopeptidase P family protein [Alphaproteobacteria bacterium]